MELDLNLQDDADMDLYCDVLVRYLLVGSSLGECALHRSLGEALDSADMEQMAAALRRFEALPEDLRSRIQDGDPTLGTMLERKARADAIEDSVTIAAKRPASA